MRRRWRRKWTNRGFIYGVFNCSAIAPHWHANIPTLILNDVKHATAQHISLFTIIVALRCSLVCEFHFCQPKINSIYSKNYNRCHFFFISMNAKRSALQTNLQFNFLILISSVRFHFRCFGFFLASETDVIYHNANKMLNAKCHTFQVICFDEYLSNPNYPYSLSREEKRVARKKQFRGIIWCLIFVCFFATKITSGC